MNIYRHSFYCICPNNEQLIRYKWELQTHEKHMVEDLIETCAKFQEAFHEEIADTLLARYRGVQILKAHHHGVEIETHRSEKRLDCRVVIGPRVFEKGVLLSTLLEYVA